MDELYKLESKLNKYNQSQIGVSIDDLNSQSFDITTYIQINYTKGRGKDLTVDYGKIKKTLGYFDEIKKNTCEEIVLSIDQNFEKYVEISQKFESLKEKLSKTQGNFADFNFIIENYDNENNEDLNKLKHVIEAYKNVSNYEDAYHHVKYVLSLMEDLKDILEENLKGKREEVIVLCVD